MAANLPYTYIDEERIPELLKCPICKQPFTNPVSTNCKDREHRFCRTCIEGWTNSQSSCHTCKQELNIQNLTSLTDPIVTGMLNMILVRCSACGQADVQRGNFDDHTNNICPRANISCPLADINCPWIGFRSDLSEHLNTCVFQSLRPLITRLQEQFNQQRREHANEQQAYITAFAIENEQLREQISEHQTQITAFRIENQRFREQITQQQTRLTEFQNENRLPGDEAERRIRQLQDELQLIRTFGFMILPCKGHPCSKCGKCRDWYHDRTNWKRHDGYTCTTNLPSLIFAPRTAGDALVVTPNGVTLRGPHDAFYFHICHCTQ